ncbi:hypothetical protein D9Q98_005642 [Chlorella vulgaris]|uniref:Asterix n=1 Tax=Chlorella vulgaris TaxID=3077 RepID=A0A9D4TMG1_CHLVU|nr:hypothetical protein D9Q98_005642 [Chlorella vulgaris]
MPIQLKASGDPRREADVHTYPRPALPDQAPLDAFLLMGLVMGMLAMIFKQKLCAWASLLLTFCAVANGKAGHANVSQFLSSSTFAVFALVSIYLLPTRQRLAAADGST